MSIPRLLRRLCFAAVMAMALSCLLARPVVDVAHDLHEAQHAGLAADHGHGQSDDAGPDDTRLADLLHAVDCCLHGATLAATSFTWTSMPRPPVLTAAPAATPHAAPATRFLRPPIPA